MDLVDAAYLIFTIFLFWLWAKALLILMNKSDDYFVGKNDKVLWFILVFFGSFFGAIIFLWWDLTKDVPIHENPLEKELLEAFDSVVKTAENKAKRS